MPRKPLRSTRERILHAAEQEFRKEGFEGASIRQIAQEARLSTGAIYNLFKDKYRLFEACITPIREDMVLKWINAYEHHGTRHSLDKLAPEDAFKQELGSVLRLIDFIFDNKDDLQLIVNKASGSKTEEFLEDLSKLGLLGDICFGVIQFKHKDANPELLRTAKSLIISPILKYFEWLIRDCETKDEAIRVAKPLFWYCLHGYLGLKNNITHLVS